VSVIKVNKPFLYVLSIVLWYYTHESIICVKFWSWHTYEMHLVFFGKTGVTLLHGHCSPPESRRCLPPLVFLPPHQGASPPVQRPCPPSTRCRPQPLQRAALATRVALRPDSISCEGARSSSPHPVVLQPRWSLSLCYASILECMDPYLLSMIAQNYNFIRFWDFFMDCYLNLCTGNSNVVFLMYHSRDFGLLKDWRFQLVVKLVVTCAFKSMKNCWGPVIETQGILLTSLDLFVECWYATFYLCAHLSKFGMFVLPPKIVQLSFVMTSNNI
jgi:hypothetical protein